MNTLLLVWNYLKAKPLTTVLNCILLSLGIAVITILLLIYNQLEEKITQNTKSIDLVVGAKGSPLQLILSSVFHVDFPTGNINLAEAETIARSRFIKSAIPLALGDSYKNFRIVGTTRSYAALYNAPLHQGAWWNKDWEVTIGANVASALRLALNDQFQSIHGLEPTGPGHEENKFIVKGILRSTNTVIDDLVLCSVESIWKIHEAHGENSRNESNSSVMSSRLVPSASVSDSTKEITAMLLQYRSPMGAIQLPRLINSHTRMQAASPAFESARLFSILGFSVEVLVGFATVLIFISGLSIFIALYNSLKERRYDLAVMRSMGASRYTLFLLVLLEGSSLTIIGSVVGLLVGHGVLLALVVGIEEIHTVGFNGLRFYSEEWIILGSSLLMGMICSLLPSIQAYRTDISNVLAGK